MALVSFEAVPRFFVPKLHAGVSVGQASLVLPSGEIANHANLMYFKFPWKVVPRSSVFPWTGIGSQVGLTFHRPNGLDVGVGLGTDTKQRNIDPVTGEETVELASAAGLFIERNASLLATLHLTEVKHRLLRVNVYPGVRPGFARTVPMSCAAAAPSRGLTRWNGTRKFGAWAILSRDRKLALFCSPSA